MRLKTKEQERNRHTDFVTAVGWTSNNELFSCSDDMTTWQWDIYGEPQGKVADLETPVTDMSWIPTVRGASDVFAVSCTDGSFKIVNKSGRVEKSVDAHQGAVTSVRWSHDGATLATAGEDGAVKLWARSGMPRSPLAQNDRPVYCISWSPNSESMAYCIYRNICVKPIQAGQKLLQWKAHEGCVLKIDWNPSNNLIVSCGEDCRYKIWDPYGRNLFTSSPYEYVVTSVAWSPNGELFAVGAFNMLRLCDKTGWTYSLNKAQSGSIFNIAWSLDGTMLAGAGGSGSVVFGYLVDKRLSWEHVGIQLDEDNKIRVLDVIHEISEELEFRDRVINLALGFEHLIVTTTTQCFIYNVQNWQTPHRFDIRESASLIVLSRKYFAIVDVNTGIQVYNYEGRLMSNPKFQGLRVEFLNSGFLSLSTDVVAVVDTANTKLVRLFDLMSGKPLSQNFEHNLEILEVAANQVEHAAERKLCILDTNRDLFLTSVHRNEMMKLSGMVDTFRWNESSDMLAAVADGKLLVWYYPNVVYVDKDLMELSRSMKDVSNDVGKMPVMDSFTGSICTIRRVDGRIATLNVSPYPEMLYECCDRGQWEKAIRLCRFVKDRTLWACLSAMSLHQRELNTAEIALAAIDEVDKVQYINFVKLIPSEAGRNAELALFSRRTAEAEQILLQGRLYYRAIKMNIRTFRWERALEIAVQNKKHIDTVVAYRRQYLEQTGREETIEKFKQFSDLETDWVTIKTKIKQDKEQEAMSGKPYDR